MIDEVYEDPELLYEFYKTNKKLKLKGVKYFLEAIPYKSLIEDLDFLKNQEKPGNIFRKEYIEINESDFYKILNKTTKTKKFPPYLEQDIFTKDVSNMEDFLLNSIQALYNNIKSTTNLNQIEIPTFISLLADMLITIDIKKKYRKYSYLEEFYARNVWKLNYKHNYTRDPDKFVKLYDKKGHTDNFGYLSLE